MDEEQINVEPQNETVKNEPETGELNSEAEPEEPDFLDELLHSADDIATAVADSSNSNTQVKSECNANANENELIDPSFFDEILTRPVDERREVSTTRIRNRLKRERVELEDGEVDDDEARDTTAGNHKHGSKSKKSKKSKHKRNREPPQKIKTEKTDSPSKSSNAAAKSKERPRIQIRAEFRSFREATPTSPPPPAEEDDASSEQPQMQIETHIGNSRIYEPIQSQLSVFSEEPEERKPEKELTSEEKLSKALERIIYAKRAFRKDKLEKEKQFYAHDTVFAYTPTVRKLPTSFSHFTQQIYDNRSPLHTVNNVTFQFNSMVTRLNFEEWGLESLPPKAKAVARTLGYDVDTLFVKRLSIKIPDKIQKSSDTTTSTENKELCEKSHSTLFMNVMVQTDDVKVIPIRRRDFYHDVGLQSTPPTNVIGTQTNPLYTGSGADLPLFNVIRKLNENQLEALDDFVQLILEPTGDSSIDLYQQRKRLADIYKTSQIPTEDPKSFKRSANEAGLSESMPLAPPPPSIYLHRDSIKTESNNYHQLSGEWRKAKPPNQRHVHSQPNSRYINLSDDEPTPSVKFYGRGGMRR